MSFQDPLSTTREVLIQSLEECVRYEQLVAQWWDEATGTLPTRDEVEWVEQHRQTCVSGTHTPEHSSDLTADLAATLSESAPVSPGSLNSVMEILVRAQAIEHRCDYILPSGLHSDTHINIGRISESEELLQSVAVSYRRCLADVDFDTVISTGWAIASIARRVLRGWDGRPRNVRQLCAEGYDPVVVLGTIRPGARVVLLLDVVVTASLLAQLIAHVEGHGAQVVKCIALAAPETRHNTREPQCEALCRIPMTIAEPSNCARCGVFPPADFNPISYQMTERKPLPRSPSAFLKQNPAATELWQLIDQVRAYERHHVEGQWHYVAFVDTLQLLRHNTTGSHVAKRLANVVKERSGVPDVLLVPDRARARYLAQLLVQVFEIAFNTRVERLFVTGRRSSYRMPSGASLLGRRVLVVDAAAGHGDTLDELCLMAVEAGAGEVGAAVMLSRLSEGHEKALNHRLSGGFSSLYSLPVRPVQKTCSLCERRSELKRLAHSLGPMAEAMARPLWERRGFPKRVSIARTPRQIPLFAPNVRTAFSLTSCAPRVASGIGLHALAAAMGDGMAPLELPEIFDEAIPVRTRLALLEDLPTSVVRWSGKPLEAQLCRYLCIGDEKRLWLAVADLLARGGASVWIDCLAMPISRGVQWMDDAFWERLALTAQHLSHGDPDTANEARGRLRALAELPSAKSAAGGLLTVVEALKTP